MFVNFGLPPAKIRLIFPSSMQAKTPDVMLPETISKFIATHDPVLLTVSGLEPEYDLPLQIEALGYLRKTNPLAGLLIVGAGSLEVELRNRIETASYADHVLLAGDTPHQAVLRVMSLSQILLRTTLYDGDSIAIREALHFGLPVVATDNGMRPKGVTLVPIGDLDGLCREVESALRKPQFRHTSPGADTSNLSAVLRLYEELLCTT
jgi:glycosyltransferase involved in cell wall biosynthesis